MSRYSRVIITFMLVIIAIYGFGVMGLTEYSSISIVTIRGHHIEPESLTNKNTILLKGRQDGEFVEVVVLGTIFDFQLIRMEWDDNQASLIEKEVIHQISEVKNNTVVIETYMPEGIPSEKITWESITGKKYEFIICEDPSADAQPCWEFVCDE